MAAGSAVAMVMEESLVKKQATQRGFVGTHHGHPVAGTSHLGSLWSAVIGHCGRLGSERGCHDDVKPETKTRADLVTLAMNECKDQPETRTGTGTGRPQAKQERGTMRSMRREWSRSSGRGTRKRVRE